MAENSPGSFYYNDLVDEEENPIQERYKAMNPKTDLPSVRATKSDPNLVKQVREYVDSHPDMTIGDFVRRACRALLDQLGVERE